MGADLHGLGGPVTQMGRLLGKQLRLQPRLCCSISVRGLVMKGGPAASIPRADPAAAEWKQPDGCALVRGRGE